MENLETIEKVLIIAYVWKICVLVVGTVFMLIGYRLFMKGFDTGKLEIQAQKNNSKLSLKHLAPGSFFALLGTVIICVAILDSFMYEGNGQTFEEAEVEFIEKNEQEVNAEAAATEENENVH